jgi:hypothetical protein
MAFEPARELLQSMAHEEAPYDDAQQCKTEH